MLQDINLLLLLLVVLLYFINFLILKGKRKNKLYEKYSVKDLTVLLSKLSLDMNNQVLSLETEKHNEILKLMKYQSFNLWGIKIIINLSDKVDVLDQINYNENIPIYFENDKLIMDVGNDFEEIIRIVKVIFSCLVQFDSDFYFNCSFKKKSVNSLR